MIKYPHFTVEKMASPWLRKTRTQARAQDSVIFHTMTAINQK